jgi:hypothetical protein
MEIHFSFEAISVMEGLREIPIETGETPQEQFALWQNG